VRALPSTQRILDLIVAKANRINAYLRKVGSSATYQLPDMNLITADVCFGARNCVVRSLLLDVFGTDSLAHSGYQEMPSPKPLTLPPIPEIAVDKCGIRVFDSRESIGFTHTGVLPNGSPETPTGDSRYVAVVQNEVLA